MPHRILVVDDEETVRALVKDYLETQGLRVYGAADGDQGIKQLEESKPHLVVIDFLLPRKNGFAVADAVRTRPGGAKIPIIMMSGVFKNPKTAVEAREKYQVIDFLSKPLDMEQLARLVRKALDGVDPGPDLPEPKAEKPQPAKRAPSDRPAPRGLSYGSTSAPEVDADPVEDVVRDGVYQGRPFKPLAEEGTIDEFPPALLLSVIRYDRGTGMLDMTDQGTHRRIYITQGQPTFMQSNAEGENVGALLLRRGRVTEPDFVRCQKYMKEKGRTLQQSMLELRLVSEADLATAYKLLAGQLLPLALGMSSGTYRWRETDAFIGRVPEGKFEPVAVLFDGIKRHVHPPQILKFFKAREDIPLVRTREFDKLMPFFRRTFSASNIAQEIDGAQTYRTLTRTHSADAASVVPQLFALVTSGMVYLAKVNANNAMEIAVNQMAAEIADMGGDGPLELSFTDGSAGDAHPDDARSRAMIEKQHDKVMSSDFFQIFDVDRGAEPDAIKAAYFEIAKKFSPDLFANRNLGSSKRKLDELFARVTEAYETITDRQKRDEYMLYLDRKAKGLPTDVNEVHRSEQLFEQAMAMIRRRDFRGAKQVLDEALTRNPDPTYYAHLGWVTFNLNQRSQAHVTEAVQHLKRAVTEQENLSIAYQYLGQICFVRGNYGEAHKWWTRCLEFEPNNIEAARGIRMVKEREEKQQQTGKQGLLSKFLGNEKK
jgi:CheY-like chemotaxis protein/tetratricopeptide (TPR) repeat protein